MNFEAQLAAQDLKRDFQRHMAEEHGELIPRDDIEVVIFKTACDCHAPIDIDFASRRGKCTRCGREATVE
jgi:hypothetical protein